MEYCSFMRAPTINRWLYSDQIGLNTPTYLQSIRNCCLCLILVHRSAVSIHHHLSAVESIAICFRLETVLKRPQCCQHRLVCRIKVLDLRDQIMLHRKGIRAQHMVASRSVLVVGIMASYLDFADTRRFVRIEIADVQSVSSSTNDNVSWLLRYVPCLIYSLLWNEAISTHFSKCNFQYQLVVFDKSAALREDSRNHCTAKCWWKQRK